VTPRVEALLPQLSLTEKLALLSGSTPFWAGMLDIARHDASHQHPWPAAAVPRLQLAGLQFVDGPRGVVLRGGATTFPAPITRGASWDPGLEERVGEAIAREGRSFGANWFAVVCVNLLRHPGWGRAQETYGEDPLHVGVMGAACTRGVQRHGIACVKHLALNSIDRSRFVVDVQIEPRALHELYLPQFRACIEAGAGSVMSAYNRVNGQWCSEHHDLLTTILRSRWGFAGFVVSDFIFGIRDGERALLAGLDLEMPFPMVFHGALPAALAQGRIPLARVDAAVRRLLQAQLSVPTGTYPVQLRGCSAHRELAREVATKSIVLLRNEPLTGGAPLLPLQGARSLAVLGPLAAVANLGDRGSSDTRPEPGVVITPLAGLQQAAPDLAIAHDPGHNARAAAALAARCDAAVLVVGLDWRHEGEHIHPGDIAPVLRHTPPPQALARLLPEPLLQRLWSPLPDLLAWLTRHGSARPGSAFASGDRTDLELPAQQQRLIAAVVAANPRTVVVLMGGGAILCERWRLQVPAIVLLGYPGEQGGAALADVLLGRVSPAGRLPFVVPTAAGHLPAFDPRARQVRYDLWHGYRRLQRHGHAAAFPFGFGLSYSAVDAFDLAVAPPHNGQTLQLAVSLRNRGPMATDTVVQVYGEPPGQLLARPLRQLVGFQRLHLAAGEQRRLQLTLPLQALAYFDAEQDGFRLEPGLHRLVVARHAEDPGLAVALELEGISLGR
jgi:beta-glucosidase